MAKFLAGVIGWPVAHSLSPRLHNYWLKRHGIAGEYVKIPVRPGELEQALRALPAQGYVGVNITVPHKQAVLPYLAWADTEGKKIGAVNTIAFEEDGAKGFNTDIMGFVENIIPALVEAYDLPSERDMPAVAKTKKAAVLGAGGAAAAAVSGLFHMGFSEVTVVNRNEEKAERLAQLFGFRAAAWGARAQALAGADLLVNATSLGLEGQPPLALDLSALPQHAIVADLIYSPLMTPLLEQAKKRGLKIVDGLGMLMHQGALAFELWTGVKPSVDAGLRAHLLEAL